MAHARDAGKVLRRGDGTGRLDPLQDGAVVGKHRVPRPFPGLYDVCRPAEDHLEAQLAGPAVDAGGGQGLRRQQVRTSEIEGGAPVEALGRRQPLARQWQPWHDRRRPFVLPAYPPALNLRARGWRHGKDRLRCHRRRADGEALWEATTALLPHVKARFHQADGPRTDRVQHFCTSA